MNKLLPYNMRAATEADAPFIFNAWLKSYRNSLFAKALENHVYFSEHHKLIERILKYYQVIIACAKDDPNQIYGFICAGHTEGVFTLHYLYIKHPFRKMGIAKNLLNCFEHDEGLASVYTHHTRVAQVLAPKYNMIYHPYISFDPSAYLKKGTE